MTETSTPDLQAEADAGDEVERMMAHPAVRARLRKQREMYYDLWLKEEDAAKREVLWVKAKVQADVVLAIQAVVSDGAVAKNQLRQRQNR